MGQEGPDPSGPPGVKKKPWLKDMVHNQSLQLINLWMFPNASSLYQDSRIENRDSRSQPIFSSSWLITCSFQGVGIQDVNRPRRWPAQIGTRGLRAVRDVSENRVEPTKALVCLNVWGEFYSSFRDLGGKLIMDTQKTKQMKSRRHLLTVRKNAQERKLSPSSAQLDHVCRIVMMWTLHVRKRSQSNFLTYECNRW